MLGALFRIRDFKLVEQHGRKLTRRIDVEFSTGEAIDDFGDFGGASGKFLAQLVKLVDVHLDSALFHCEKHVGERSFGALVKLGHAQLFHVVKQAFPQRKHGGGRIVLVVAGVFKQSARRFRVNSHVDEVLKQFYVVVIR